MSDEQEYDGGEQAGAQDIFTGGAADVSAWDIFNDSPEQAMGDIVEDPLY